MTNTHRPRALLMLLAAAVLVVGLLALVGANPAWAVQWGSQLPRTPTGDFARPGGISVLLGNGDGSFQPKQDFEVATNRHPNR